MYTVRGQIVLLGSAQKEGTRHNTIQVIRDGVVVNCDATANPPVSSDRLAFSAGYPRGIDFIGPLEGRDIEVRYTNLFLVHGLAGVTTMSRVELASGTVATPDAPPKHHDFVTIHREKDKTMRVMRVQALKSGDVQLHLQ